MPFNSSSLARTSPLGPAPMIAMVDETVILSYAGKKLRVLNIKENVNWGIPSLYFTFLFEWASEHLNIYISAQNVCTARTGWVNAQASGSDF